MRRSSAPLLALLALLALLVAGADARSARPVTAADNNEVTSDNAEALPQDQTASSARSWTPSWTEIARCAIAAAPLECVEQRSQRAVDAMLTHMSEARAAKDEAALEPEVVDKVAELSEIVVEAAASLMERKLRLHPDDDDDDDQGLVEEGRKKKKKKIHKLIALVKLVLLVLVVKLKLAFLMMALQTLFQFKIMVLVFLILLTKKISLWATLKHHKTQEAQKVIIQHSNHGSSRQRSPETRVGDDDNSGSFDTSFTPERQVIYYEHAQHQHHYDDHGGWNAGGGHEEHHDEHSGGGGGGGWGNLWGRSYETATGSSTGSVGSLSTAGVQSGIYRAADGSRIVVRPSDAHDMAFSAQRP